MIPLRPDRVSQVAGQGIARRADRRAEARRAPVAHPAEGVERRTAVAVAEAADRTAVGAGAVVAPMEAVAVVVEAAAISDWHLAPASLWKFAKRSATSRGVLH